MLSGAYFLGATESNERSAVEKDVCHSLKKMKSALLTQKAYSIMAILHL